MSFQQFPPLKGENPGVYFTSEDVDFKLEKEEATGEWLKKTIEQEGKQLLLLNFIFCSDKYLHRLNVEYLQHDTFTDVITFPYAELPVVEGDIFISIERVKENAEKFKVPFLKELQRVMVHGVLHLCGY
ncbi:MAG TPA: rRNA maturation RNase YbeY, partial [Bacteroidetes bacterium]|nr:rRNA maturation RNase YbeY [Bacteroidota bacterium]